MKANERNLYASSMSHNLEGCKKNDGSQVLNSVAKTLLQAFISTPSGRILKLAITKGVNQKYLDEQLAYIDIEALWGSDALLLAYAKQRHAALDFGDYNEPRLKGLLMYHRFQNLNCIALFTKVINMATTIESVPIASYDTAMSCLLPEQYRPFCKPGLVAKSEKHFVDLKQAVKNAGYLVQEDVGFFTVLENEKNKERGINVFLSTGFGVKEITAWQSFISRTSATQVFRNSCLIPSVEDMLATSICRIWTKLRTDPRLRDLAFDIWDLFCLKERQKMDVELLQRIVVERNMAAQYYLVGCFVNNIIPGLLPELWKKHESFERAIDNYLKEEESYLEIRYDKQGNRRFQGLRYFLEKLGLWTKVSYWAHRILGI